jgi:flagellar hook assembly protein FlgD
MWKKFMAAMAITVLLSTSTSLALTSTVTPVDSINGYITDFAVTGTFSPSTKETAQVAFNWEYTTDLHVYVYNNKFETVATLVPRALTTAGQKNFVWYGTQNNVANGTPLADGNYLVRVFAYPTSNNTVLDYVSQTVTITNSTTSVQPQITNLSAYPGSFDAIAGKSTSVSFKVSQDAFVTAVVKDSSGVAIREFTNYDDDNDFYSSTVNHSITWDGNKDGGNTVADGNYTIEVYVRNANGTDKEYTTVVVNTGTVTTSGDLSNLQLDPSGSWDPTDEDLEISFDLNEDADDLTIEAKKGLKTIDIYDDTYADADDYSELWDGTDEDGDYVDAGTWTIVVTADNSVVSKTITVEYEQPNITEAFVTKTVFDVEEGEFTYLLFKVDADATVDVDLYRGSKKEMELLEDSDVSKNKWYAVKWDGTDEDDDEVAYGGDWKFKITAKNVVQNNVVDVEYVEVDVKEDSVSSSKTNVTNDFVNPPIFDDRESKKVIFEYCLDDAAEVYIAVYEGKNASGSPKAELVDYDDHSKGCYKVSWDVKNSKDKLLSDDVYSYKVISRTDDGNKDIEIGRFVVGNEGGVDDKTDTKPKNTPKDVDLNSTCGHYYWDLTYLSDDNELCQAIAWVTEKDIFDGYPDGAFRPYDNINRAEVLKVVLEAFDNVTILPADGTNQGFWDVDSSAWYMKYVRTGKFYNMLHGYPDGSAMLDQDINRVEFLKFVLEASERFTSYEFVNGYYADYYYADVSASDSNVAWFLDYATTAHIYNLYNTEFVNGQEYLRPAQMVERGEVALLFYRMEKAGILNF